MKRQRVSEKVEEPPAKKPKLDTEISTKLMNTKDISDLIWLHIFGFLNFKEIKLSVAKVCRHFYDISNDCVQKIEMAHWSK